jgi:hypothetical protein
MCHENNSEGETPKSASVGRRSGSRRDKPQSLIIVGPT